VGSVWRRYLQPASLADALQALRSAPGPVCPIAGGTDLLLDLRQGNRTPVHTLVDVSGIPELTALEVRMSSSGEAELFIGAAVPYSHVIASPLVNQHARALVEACDLIGGPQVRNVATLGGNVAHALPAADGAIALLALDAYVEIAQPGNSRPLTTKPEVVIRKKPLLDLYIGPGKTALEPGQLLVGFYLRLSGPGQGTAFKRVMRAQGVALPVLNVAVWVKCDQEKVADLRIAIGPAGPVPQRALIAESVLRGHSLTTETLSRAQQALLGEVRFRTSPQRATAEYRQQLAGRLLADALDTAWKRAM
jgi:CO/xanthine dehydrogenase FAD-binding subunit